MSGNWLERNGAIIFSQYRTTAEWVLEALCGAFPDEPVALYAGGAASFVQRGPDRRSAAREQIKSSIQQGDIRLVCATDAACEGLNLQRLGAQVNVDLPWNPSRLEQRKGRVQRIGQVRDEVHILSLRYAGTVEDDVYATLSNRFGDIFSVLGQLPDGFEDQWIDAVLRRSQAVRNFSQRVEKARPPMELRYMRDVADDSGLDWEYTGKGFIIARPRRMDAARVVIALCGERRANFDPHPFEAEPKKILDLCSASKQTTLANKQKVDAACDLIFRCCA